MKLKHLTYIQVKSKKSKKVKRVKLKAPATKKPEPIFQPPVTGKTVIVKSKKKSQKDNNYVKDVPYIVTFVDKKVKDCKNFEYEVDDDGIVTEIRMECIFALT